MRTRLISGILAGLLLPWFTADMATADDPFRLSYQVIPVKEVPKRGSSSIARRLLRKRDWWVAGRSDHFYVMGKTVRQVSTAVEEAEAAYGWTEPWIPGGSGDEFRSLVFMIYNHDLWVDIIEGHGLRHDSLAMQLQRELYLKEDPEQDKRPDRIAHEVVHARLYDADASPLPIWLEEGLATYLGWRCAVDFQGKRGVTLFRNLPALEEGEILPVAGLLALRTYPADPAATRAFYRQSEEWIALLAENIGASGIRNVIDRARTINVDQLALLQEITGIDDVQMAELEQELVRRCREPLVN